MREPLGIAYHRLFVDPCHAKQPVKINAEVFRYLDQFPESRIEFSAFPIGDACLYTLQFHRQGILRQTARDT